MAPGCSAYRSTLPALCPFHDQPQRAPGEDPAHTHISAEHPQRLELPLLITTNTRWTLKYYSSHTGTFCQFLFLFPSCSFNRIPRFTDRIKPTEDQSKAETSLHCGLRKCGQIISGILPMTHICCRTVKKMNNKFDKCDGSYSAHILTAFHFHRKNTLE